MDDWVACTYEVERTQERHEFNVVFLCVRKIKKEYVAQSCGKNDGFWNKPKWSVVGGLKPSLRIIHASLEANCARKKISHASRRKFCARFVFSHSPETQERLKWLKSHQNKIQRLETAWNRDPDVRIAKQLGAVSVSEASASKPLWFVEPRLRRVCLKMLGIFPMK